MHTKLLKTLAGAMFAKMDTKTCNGPVSFTHLKVLHTARCLIHMGVGQHHHSKNEEDCKGTHN